MSFKLKYSLTSRNNKSYFDSISNTFQQITLKTNQETYFPLLIQNATRNIETICETIFSAASQTYSNYKQIKEISPIRTEFPLRTKKTFQSKFNDFKLGTSKKKEVPSLSKIKKNENLLRKIEFSKSIKVQMKKKDEINFDKAPNNESKSIVKNKLNDNEIKRKSFEERKIYSIDFRKSKPDELKVSDKYVKKTNSMYTCRNHLESHNRLKLSFNKFNYDDIFREEGRKTGILGKLLLYKNKLNVK